MGSSPGPSSPLARFSVVYPWASGGGGVFSTRAPSCRPLIPWPSDERIDGLLPAAGLMLVKILCMGLLCRKDDGVQNADWEDFDHRRRSVFQRVQRAVGASLRVPIHRLLSAVRKRFSNFYSTQCNQEFTCDWGFGAPGGRMGWSPNSRSGMRLDEIFLETQRIAKKQRSLRNRKNTSSGAWGEVGGFRRKFVAKS